ncbi:MAG: peptidoglycan-binding domain-containing protein [Mariprofundaceae bacterium]
MARPMKMFMRGKNVRLLQSLLRTKGFSIGDQPGMFGTCTRDAVKTIQKQYGLKADAVVNDALMLMMQQGMAAVVVDKKESDIESVVLPVDQMQLDALIRLMVKKGLINAEELEAELKQGSDLSKLEPTEL